MHPANPGRSRDHRCLIESARIQDFKSLGTRGPDVNTRRKGERGRNLRRFEGLSEFLSLNFKTNGLALLPVPIVTSHADSHLPKTWGTRT